MFSHVARYSPQAHDALNEHVNGIISETHSVAAVNRHFEESQELEGTAAGVQPGSVASAKNICKAVLKTRLRESATDAIYAGRRRNEHPGKLSSFASSCANAKASGWLDDELKLDEFSHLLKNFQVRSEAGQECRDHTTAESLINQLYAHIEPPAEGDRQIERLTDTSLSAILLSLLRMMQRNPEACNKLVDLGLVVVVSRLFCSDGLDYKVQGPNPDFPEVQMCLARVLAEVALQSARESTNSVRLDPRLTRSMALGDNGQDGKPVPKPPEPPPISAQAQWAIATLVAGLRQSLRRSEHAPVWAVITACQRLADDPFACKQLLAAGLLSALRNARQIYAEQSSGGRLPLAVPRPKERPPMLTKAIPTFVGAVSMPPALTKDSLHAKERWMVKSESMPELPRSDQRSSATFLAGSPVAQRKSPKRRGQHPSPLAKLGKAQMASEGGSGLFLCGSDYPSLLWLIGEDSVDKESFYKVTDRSLMLLQLRKLLKTMEEADLRFGKQIAASPWLAGGIMADRPDSRGAVGSRSGIGSRSGTGSRGGRRGANTSTLP